MRKIISLICFLLPVLASAGQTQTAPQLRSDAPDQYTVVQGDTLWGISGKFFKDPWRWPYIWGMNKEAIKDPHWIYPGATIFLDRANGTLSMQRNGNTSEIVKLSPQIRAEESVQTSIPSIPSRVIEPFLSQPLVIGEDLLAGSPTLVGFLEERVIAATGDVVYAKGLKESEGNNWQIYRPGKAFIDPQTREILGHEAIYLGNLEVRKFGDISAAVIKDAKQEINLGDRLVKPAAITTPNYLPRAPDSQISAQIISIYGGVTQAGQNTVITLNKGSRDGLQTGHVLALSNKGRIVKQDGRDMALPDERYGLIFVFRVFDKVSYALVMQTTLPAQVLDRAQTP